MEGTYGDDVPRYEYQEQGQGGQQEDQYGDNSQPDNANSDVNNEFDEQGQQGQQGQQSQQSQQDQQYQDQPNQQYPQGQQ